MKPRLLKLIEAVRSSYWFVPTMMAILALLLGVGVVYVDADVGSEWLNDLAWYQNNKPAGAREVLSTIAGSSITVAGVVFSITIVAISFAAAQYGPRILTNFMSDRGNQVTLGTFVATFLYCLVVLRTIRGGEESDFVPDIAVLVGLGLAICSIAVLIYFIHHVPLSIHVNTVAAGIGRRLVADVGERFPEFIGDARGADCSHKVRSSPALEAFARSNVLRRPAPDVASIRSEVTGYIQSIDDEALLEIARRHDLALQLRYQPGDYVHAGRAFAEVWPAARATDGVASGLRDAFAVGDRCTPTQDLRFLIDELVEISARALSPGVNDPFTAITCLDWLGSAASELAGRRLPDRHRVDENGALRVVAQPLDFAEFVERSFGQLRQYVATDRNAALHALRTIGEVATACETEDQLRALRDEADRLAELAADELGPSLMAPIRERLARLRLLLDQPVDAIGQDAVGRIDGAASP